MVTVSTPSSAAEVEQVRALMRAFVAWHRGRHRDDLALIDRYFDAPAFEAELASLPGKYAPPDGGLLLATYDGRAAGCVALRRIDHQACEMKRMYVDAGLHGKGIGRALGRAVIDAARAAGYRTMYLDTSIRQHEAMALYRSLGFREIAPYYDVPPELRDWLVFMELDLA